MALERSVLDFETIASSLLKHYGISVTGIHKLELGTANCYRVSDGARNYFLKEFQSDYTPETVTKEAGILEYLSEKDIPVSKVYKTLSGEYTLFLKGKTVCLQKYIEGTSYGYENMPERLLPQLAQLLGRLHAALRDYPMDIKMGEDWLASFSAASSISKYDALLEIADQNKNDKHCNQIVTDITYKKELALRCEDYKKYYRGITYSPTHGDFQGCQLIFAGDDIKAVTDFSAAGSLPVTWEIMRSFMHSSESVRKNAVIDIDAFCKYVSEYMKYTPLTAADLASMAYVYLFQLARSQYGYYQYLTSDSEDREGLINFAFWRPRMCREVEMRAGELSAALSELI